MIGDGFYPIRAHLKAIADSFRRQARGVVPDRQPLHRMFTAEARRRR
jgi:hypothetical protein